jgi:hypothetical protein
MIHEIEIQNNRTNTKYSQTTQKQAHTLLSTMSHSKTQMIWNRKEMRPLSGIKTIKTTSSKMSPAPDVESVTSSSSLSQASSIGIGELGLNLAWRGTAAAFSMAIKDDLFPEVKFLQGTNTSLDFNPGLQHCMCCCSGVIRYARLV